MYAVIGANGFLGSYVVKNILEQTTDSVLATTRDLSRVYEKQGLHWEYCDLEDEASVNKVTDIIKTSKTPVKLVYLSAYHHPDQVSKHPILAWHINVTLLSSFLEKLGGGTKFYVCFNRQCLWRKQRRTRI